MASTQPLKTDPGRDWNRSRLMSPEEARAAIEDGKVLWLAAEGDLLKDLPKGRWIGGSIPYFMGEAGGEVSRDKIFATELDVNVASKIQVKFYDVQTITTVVKDAPENGFSVVLLPAGTEIHSAYAENAPNYEDMFLKPVAGWVTGVHLDDLGKVKPLVVNGLSGEISTDKALVMHVALKPGKAAHIGIVNTLAQGDGDVIEFPRTGFNATDCLVNGEARNFCEYLGSTETGSRLPLVANYCGAMVNVSIQTVDDDQGSVSFYAPVFKGVRYKLAAPVADYVSAFHEAIPAFDDGVSFSCNCVLNYVYAELEGKRTGNVLGPMTFGEIAYQLLNQTLVYMVIEDVAA